MEVPQVQYIDKTNAPVETQGQALASQSAQKTLDMPHVQFLHRGEDVPVAAQTPVDIPVLRIAEEFIEVFNACSQSRAQQPIVEPTTETPAASLDEKNMEAPKIQMQESIAEKSDVPVPRRMEEITEAVQHILQERAHTNTGGSRRRVVRSTD